jgi:tryptophan halogenase
VKYREGVFLEASWIAVYLGQRVFPQGHDMRADAPPADALARGMETLHGQIQGVAERMPEHAAMLARYCPMAA